MLFTNLVFSGPKAEINGAIKTTALATTTAKDIFLLYSSLDDNPIQINIPPNPKAVVAPVLTAHKMSGTTLSVITPEAIPSPIELPIQKPNIPKAFMTIPRYN